MFFLLAIVSMLGYSTQGVLVTKYAREIDALSASTYRTLSLGITMLPLLFFVSWSDIFELHRVWQPLLLSALMGTIASWTRFTALRYLAVGVHSALSTSLRTIGIIALGAVFFAEYITMTEAILVAIILIAGSFLTLRKQHMPHLDSRTWVGIGFVFLTALFSIGMILLLADVSRQIHPFVAAYFWELSIGILGLIVASFRYLANGNTFEKISLNTFGKIALVSSPTILGTGGFTLAMQYGPVGIASAIGAGGILVMTIMAHFLYHEKLSRWHWIAMILLVVGIAGLKVLGG